MSEKVLMIPQEDIRRTLARIGDLAQSSSDSKSSDCLIALYTRAAYRWRNAGAKNPEISTKARYRSAHWTLSATATTCPK